MPCGCSSTSTRHRHAARARSGARRAGPQSNKYRCRFASRCAGRLTGIWGSGKSSLAFSTRFAESQRRYRGSVLPKCAATATLLAWLERRGGSIGDYLFPSRIDLAGHMSTRQCARLVDEWVTAIGLRKAEYGTHSLRRTKVAMIYRATARCRSCLATRRSKTLCATWALTSKTLCS